MKVLNLLLFIIIGSFSLTSSAQEVELGGYWTGTITQDEGGYRSNYRLEFFIDQEKDRIDGTAFVQVDTIYAEMKITGELHSGIYLQVRDLEIVEHEEVEGMEWCLKKYQLLLKQKGGELKLEGHWQGHTSFSSCIPGRISLTKTIPRA